MRLIANIHQRGVADACAATMSALRRVGRRAWLLVRLRYLCMQLSIAVYDEHHNADEAQRADFRGESYMCDLLMAQAASDRFVSQRLRVEIARVESSLCPVRVVA